MKILIVTQEENVYLPQSFGKVCAALGHEISVIVSAPAMSTHGGTLKGFFKHLAVFRLRGTWGMGWRIVKAKLLNVFAKSTSTGPWYSIRHVAKSFQIPFVKVRKLSSPEFEEVLNQYQPELLISMSCPQIIRKKVRDRFAKGCINVHGAPLPKYRGLMPAFWMLLNQEKKAATTVHVLDEKLDDGAILLQQEIEVTPQDTWDSLVRKTKLAGAELLVRAIRQIENGTVEYRENKAEDATYFSFPTAQDAARFYQSGRRFF